jgi:hypothetical protein
MVLRILIRIIASETGSQNTTGSETSEEHFHLRKQPEPKNDDFPTRNEPGNSSISYKKFLT